MSFESNEQLFTPDDSLPDGAHLVSLDCDAKVCNNGVFRMALAQHLTMAANSNWREAKPDVE